MKYIDILCSNYQDQVTLNSLNQALDGDSANFAGPVLLDLTVPGIRLGNSEYGGCQTHSCHPNLR